MEPLNFMYGVNFANIWDFFNFQIEFQHFQIEFLHFGQIEFLLKRSKKSPGDGGDKLLNALVSPQLTSMIHYFESK